MTGLAVGYTYKEAGKGTADKIPFFDQTSISLVPCRRLHAPRAAYRKIVIFVPNTQNPRR